MKTKLTLLFILSLIFASACIKEKDEKNSPKPSYVSYTKNGQKIELKNPQWISIWTEPSSWTYANFQTSSLFSFGLFDSATTGVFPIRRYQDKYNNASIVSIEPNSQFYNLEEGTLTLTQCDTSNGIVEGTFEGKFINLDMTDSFIVNDGEFYFLKKY